MSSFSAHPFLVPARCVRPEELFAAAALLGHSALGVSDLGSVAGVVRAWEAQKATGVRSIAGTRVDLSGGRRLLLYPTDRPAWSRLTRLLTLGKTRAGKGGCLLDWPDVVPWSEGLIAILLPHEADERTSRARRTWRGLRTPCLSGAVAAPPPGRRGSHRCPGASGGRCRRPRGRDRRHPLSRARGAPAAGRGDRDPREDAPSTSWASGASADRALKSPEEMERRFALFPDAIQASVDIARLCPFDLGEIRYQYPSRAVMAGRSAQEALAALTERGGRATMFAGGCPAGLSQADRP